MIDNKVEQVINLLSQLDSLHEARKGMKTFSNYHGVYEELCIELNTELREITDLNYIDFDKTSRKLLTKLVD